MFEAVDTVYPADCVEFCTEQQSTYLAVGTYKLQEHDSEFEQKPTRVGQVRLYEVVDGTLYKFFSHLRIIKEVISGSGVLDMKWNNSLLATAHSDGDVSVYKLMDKLLSFEDSIECDSSDTLLLSLDFVGDRICASASNGKLFILSVCESGARKVMDIRAHEMEAWITKFDIHDENILYSGSDDCKLKVWDSRSACVASKVLTRYHRQLNFQGILWVFVVYSAILAMKILY